jgi:hypothetical protein
VLTGAATAPGRWLSAMCTQVRPADGPVAAVPVWILYFPYVKARQPLLCCTVCRILLHYSALCIALIMSATASHSLSQRVGHVSVGAESVSARCHAAVLIGRRRCAALRLAMQ